MVFESYIPNDYIRFVVFLVVLFITLKIVISILEKIVLKLTIKTKTDIDNKILKKTSKPFSLFVIFLGSKIAINELPIPQNLHNIISGVISSFIIIIIAYIIGSILNILVDSWGKKLASKTESTMDDNLVGLLHKSINILIAIIAFLYLLSFWGIEIGPLLASLGIAGIAIAFALQSTLSNIFGGISLILDKTIKVDDVVYLDQQTKGTILDIGLRSTKIRTFDNELIIIPNGKLSEMQIQNIVLPEPKARVVIPFNVAYGADIDNVKKIILKEINKIPDVIKDPKPFVRFKEMQDSSLLFNLYFYVKSYKIRGKTKDNVNTKIYNCLNKNKINIPFPQMDVHLKKE